jgi:aryl sulfotransferase
VTVRYRNLIFDSARWDGFAFRDDDIVISTPAKCGTTWTQMLVAMLVFDATEFDRPLAVITPWLDMNTRPLESVLADLESQTHRRFIKTHTPLDGLPFDERVTYVCVGRDPRDAGLSMDHHLSNMNFEALLAMRAASVGMEDLDELGPPPEAPPDDPVERFWNWTMAEDFRGLAHTLAHIETFWDRRDQANVALFHYSDYQTDLPGQLARLAEVLGIERSRARIEELAEAASFASMKARAAELAPNSDQGLWHSTEDFFHRGVSGQWRELLDDADLDRYWARVNELVAPDVATWAHNGWLAKTVLGPETHQF